MDMSMAATTDGTMRLAGGTEKTGSRSPGLPLAGLDLGPGRRRVTQQDVDVFQALVGGAPPHVDADTAPHLPQRESAPIPLRPGDHPAHPVRKVLARIPRVVCLQLADCYQGVTQRIGGPDLSDVGSWLRRVSVGCWQKVQDARTGWADGQRRRSA
jgi:hypothetical protein